MLRDDGVEERGGVVHEVFILRRLAVDLVDRELVLLLVAPVAAAGRQQLEELRGADAPVLARVSFHCRAADESAEGRRSTGEEPSLVERVGQRRENVLFRRLTAAHSARRVSGSTRWSTAASAPTRGSRTLGAPLA